MGHQLGRIQYPQINRTKDKKKKMLMLQNNVSQPYLVVTRKI